VPDKPVITDVVSGDWYVVLTWQIESAVNANPGHTFYVRYRHTGDVITSLSQVLHFVSGDP